MFQFKFNGEIFKSIKFKNGGRGHDGDRRGDPSSRDRPPKSAGDS
jgi:hypothetical protein